MSTDTPSFPRGFIFATRPVNAPESFEPEPLLPQLHVHPWLRVATAGDTDLFVVVLGSCVPISGTDSDPSEALLEKLREGEGAFLQALDHYVGRHAVIYGSDAAPKVVNDATGMRAVFYAADGGVISSHAVLVEGALGGAIERNPVPFQYGFPGNRTPYERTRLLMPNTYLDIATSTIHRFWPTHALEERSVDDVAQFSLDAAVNAMREISRDRTVKLGLTAGLDTRTVFAAILKAGIPVETYTYGRSADTVMDRTFAPDLAARNGVPHGIVPTIPNSAELRGHLDEVHYKGLHRPVIRSLMKWFGDPDTIAVSANLLEIGRSFYLGARRSSIPAPVTAEAMTFLHHRRMGGKMKEEIEAFGFDRYCAISDAAFQAYLDETDYMSVVGLLEPFDHFYWEHRMPAWHGTALVERDFYGDAFIPMNSRAVFEAMLSVPQEDRDAANVVLRMIELADPSLLELPINPKEWPPAH